MRSPLFFYHEQTRYKVLLGFSLNAYDSIYWADPSEVWIFEHFASHLLIFTCAFLAQVKVWPRCSSVPSTTKLHYLRNPSQQPGWRLVNLPLIPLLFLDKSWFSFGRDLLLFPSLLAATLGRCIWLYTLIVRSPIEGQKKKKKTGIVENKETRMWLLLYIWLFLFV